MGPEHMVLVSRKSCIWGGLVALRHPRPLYLQFKSGLTYPLLFSLTTGLPWLLCGSAKISLAPNRSPFAVRGNHSFVSATDPWGSSPRSVCFSFSS